MNEITEGNFPEVRSRQEMYLQDIIKSLSNESISDNNYPDPLSRQEAYLQIIISKLRANDPNIEINTEDIEKAVNKYLEQNPIQPGATENQVQQIEKNKKDVASLKAETGSLKEDLSNKITKFYASSQGETHITDSDNGKIMDMKVFGKSSQDGTPSPENPVEIKSVVNPMIKVCGVNLFDQTKVFKNIDIGIRSIVGINCYNIVGNGQSTDRRYYLIECKPNTKYYITFVNSNNNIFYRCC